MAIKNILAYYIYLLACRVHYILITNIVPGFSLKRSCTQYRKIRNPNQIILHLFSIERVRSVWQQSTEPLSLNFLWKKHIINRLLLKPLFTSSKCSHFRSLDCQTTVLLEHSMEQELPHSILKTKIVVCLNWENLIDN